jgi:hypothetical protein
VADGSCAPQACAAVRFDDSPRDVGVGGRQDDRVGDVGSGRDPLGGQGFGRCAKKAARTDEGDRRIRGKARQRRLQGRDRRPVLLLERATQLVDGQVGRRSGTASGSLASRTWPCDPSDLSVTTADLIFGLIWYRVLATEPMLTEHDIAALQQILT